MLEVKHLRKEYRTKKGVVTKALDDVSLTFPETGMVFILGKSGSGKSTLLNVCGGLDRADSGEIIIKGKSSAEFSGQDFDSYRNTYVGFVFQEYNILDEFTVEENIALALELQNKKRDREVIAKILADVDMTAFSARKPNTLSGGQKQRVAIARALVKEPEIIMADEPTGALDSKTGQQVFDTLKHLSQTKLVLVISHDREFAEQYADRIIELKDGIVISDQTRAAAGEGAQNVRFFGTDTVCVQNGADVTDADLESIRAFLKRSGGSAVISTSREQITAMKQDKPEMAVGAFENIKEQPVSKQYEKQKLIRSHLPARHALRMGASGLKTKPVRLVFTILLSVAAFILFGLASTLMLFDGKSVTVQTLVDSDYDRIVLSKSYYETNKQYNGDKLNDEYESKLNTPFTLEEYKALRDKYAGAVAAVDARIPIDNVSMSSAISQFYSNTIDGAVLADQSLQVLAGRLPTAADEIAISDFMFDGFKTEGCKFTYEAAAAEGTSVVELKITDYDSVLYSKEKPVTLNVRSMPFKIVGVYKGMAVPGDYAEMKAAADKNQQYNDTSGGMLSYQWQTARSSGMYARIAVTEELVEKYLKDTASDEYIDASKYFDYGAEYVRIGIATDDPNGIYGSDARWFATYDRDGARPTLKLYATDGTTVTALGANDAAVNYRNFISAYSQTFNDYDNKNNPSRNPDEYRRLQEIAQAARDEWEAQNPEPEQTEERFYDKVRFESDLAEWQSRYDAYVAQDGNAGVTEEEYESTTGDYKPELLSYSYYMEVWYWEAYNEWENAGRNVYDTAFDNANKLKPYADLETRVKSEADEIFAMLFPEPDRDSDYDKWQEWENNRYNFTYEYWEENAPDKVLNYWEPSDGKDKLFKAFGELDKLFDELGIAVEFKIGNEYSEPKSVNVVGMFFEDVGDAAYLGSALYDEYYKPYDQDGNWHTVTETKYVVPEDAYISAVYIPYDHSAALTEALVEMTYVRNADDSSASILNPVMSQLEMLIDMADTLGTAFLIIGIVLAVFAFLLMFNFISASITAKKKEIGILRAIGARTTDVFKIFLSEALIIALICFVISTAGAWGTCILLNTVLTADTILSVSIFVFGPISVLCILAIALLTAAVSTIIPVGLYSRKPPVASIRAL